MEILAFRRIIVRRRVMSKINAVLSFLVNNTPANNTANNKESVMKTIPAAAPAKKNPEDSILLLAAKTARQAREIAKLEASAQFDDACIASQGREIAALRAQLGRMEALQGLLVRNAVLNNETAKANARKAEDLANELEVAEEATLIANNWRNEALTEANRQARLADAFRNIARSSRARKSSKFALPIVEGEVEPAELAYFDRLAIDAQEDMAESITPVSRKLIGFGKDSVEGAYHCRACRKAQAHRGHKNGFVPMSARSAFHYLNR